MLENNGFNITKVGESDLLLKPEDSLDPLSSDSLLESIGEKLAGGEISSLYYDLSRVHIIDKIYYGWLCKLARTCSIYGTELKTINMKSTAAMGLVSFIKDRPPFHTSLEI